MSHVYTETAVTRFSEKSRRTGGFQDHSFRREKKRRRDEPCSILSFFTVELPSDEELFRRQKTDRDFRRPAPPDRSRDRLRRRVRLCEHCSSSDQPWKLRNRDFNAAIDILTLLETTLRGEERLTYLCTQRAAGPPREGRRPLLLYEMKKVSLDPHAFTKVKLRHVPFYLSMV